MLSLSELGNPIAYGRTAELYAWKDGWVLKLFHDWMHPGAAEYEANLTSIAHANGAPSPAVGEVVRIDNRSGILYERLEGETMLKNISSHPWKIVYYAHLLAELHVQMHACSGAGLPSQRDRLNEKIQHAGPLPDSLKSAALAVLDRLPDGDRLCHGDFHPDNVILTKKGPVVIDWIDASAGLPAADMARTLVLSGYGALPPRAKVYWALSKMRSIFRDAYRQRYVKLHACNDQDLATWISIIAAGRLSEGIEGEESSLLELARRLPGAGLEQERSR